MIRLLLGDIVFVKEFDILVAGSLGWRYFEGLQFLAYSRVSFSSEAS